VINVAEWLEYLDLHQSTIVLMLSHGLPAFVVLKQTVTVIFGENTKEVRPLVCTERFTDLDKLNLIKFALSGLVLGSSQFLKLSQAPAASKMMLNLNVVKSDSKIFI